MGTRYRIRPLMKQSPMTFGSVFAGAGGFDMGFKEAGLECLWQIEIERTALAVLARHDPDVKRFHDVTKCGKGGKHKLRKVDVVVGGFPCQDVSVAGKREGFAGERSSLFHELCRITAELRPRFLVWENVPGLLSSYRPTDAPPEPVEGREWEVEEDSDFETVIGELGRIGYFGAWRLLDAVHAGVPQSRPRLFGVFAPGSVGARRACQVLAFPESLRGHPAASGETQPDIAGCLGGGAPGRGWSDDLERAGAFIPVVGDGSPPHEPQAVPEIAGCLSANGKAAGSATQQCAENGMLVVAPDVAFCLAAEVGRNAAGNRVAGGHSSNLIAFGGNDTRGDRRVATALSAKGGSGRMDFETETFIVNSATSMATQSHARPSTVARSLDTTGGFASGQGGTVVCMTGDTTHALTSEGADASEDGTGRGMPIVFQCHGSNVGPMGSLRAGNGNEGGGVPFVFESKKAGEGSAEAAPTLRAMGFDGSHANAGGQLAVFCVHADAMHRSSDAVTPSADAEGRVRLRPPGIGIREDGTTFALSATAPHAVAYRTAGDGAVYECGEKTAPLTTATDPCGKVVQFASGVRRLTPRECEALMGWPADYTRWRDDGTEIADGPRYRLCGNGVVKPISLWIGRRLIQANAMKAT